jgi:hypothetical protein
MNRQGLFNLAVMVLITLVVFSTSFGSPSDLRDYKNYVNLTYDEELNMITDVEPEATIFIENAFSYGLLKQQHIVKILPIDAKEVTIEPELISGILVGDFKVYRVEYVYEPEYYEICFGKTEVDLKCNKTEYTKTIETREEGNTFNRTGTFIIEYNTLPNSEGKLDLTICLDKQCYTYDPWWSSSYAYRKTITMNGALLPTSTNHNPLLIKLNSTNFNFSRIQSDCDDIRFTDSGDTTEYAFDNEVCNTTTQVANFWVDVGAQTGTFVLRIYYGNPSATSGESPSTTWDDWAVVYNFQNGLDDSLGVNPLQTLQNGVYTQTACPAGYCVRQTTGALSIYRSNTFSNLGVGNSTRIFQVLVNSTSLSDRLYASTQDNAGTFGVGLDDWYSGGFDSKITAWCINSNLNVYDNATAYNSPTNTWELLWAQYRRRNVDGLKLIHNGTHVGTTSTFTTPAYDLFDDDSGINFEIGMENGMIDFVRIDHTYMGDTTEVTGRNNVTRQMLFNNPALFTIGSEESVPTITVFIEEPSNGLTYTYTPTLRFRPVTNNATQVNCSVNINTNITNLFNIANNTLTNLSLYNIYDNDTQANSASINCSATTILGYHYGSNSTTFGLNFYNLFWQSPQSFNGNVTDNTLQIFNLTMNIVNTSELNISGLNPWIFGWNYTLYTDGFTKLTPNNDTVNFLRNLTMPTLNTTFNATIDVGWLIYVSNALTGLVYGAVSPIKQQTVSRAWVGNCSTIGIPTINFTFYDEQTLDPLLGYLDLSLSLNLDVIKQFSFDLNNQTNFTLCLYPNWATYPSTMNMTYYATGYVPRDKDLTIITLTNTSQNYDLYLLSDTEYSTVVFTIEDAIGIKQINTTMKVYKYAEALSEYILLDEGITDDYGVTVMPLELNLEYKLEFYQNNTLVHSEFKYVTSTAELIKIGTLTDPDFMNYDTTNYTYSFNNATNTTVLTVTDSSPFFNSSWLTVEKLGLLGNTLICNSTNLTCYLGNQTGVYSLILIVNYTTGYYKIVFNTLINLEGDTLNIGSTGIILGFIFLGTLVMLGLEFGDVAGLIGAVFGLLLNVLIGLWDIGITLVVGTVLMVAIIIALRGRT